MGEERSIEEISEEKVNRKALKIGREILDELYLHGDERMEVTIKKSESFDWMSVVSVGVYQITGLLEDEIVLIRNGGLMEKNMYDYEIRKVSQQKGKKI